MNWFNEKFDWDTLIKERNKAMRRFIASETKKMDYIKNEKGQKRFYSWNLEKDDACKPGIAWYDDKWERQTRGWYCTDEWDKACAQDLAKNHPDWLVWAVWKGYACEGAWELGLKERDAFMGVPWGGNRKCAEFHDGWTEAIRDREQKTSKPESREEKIERLERELAEAKKPVGFEIYGVCAPPFMPHCDDRFIFNHSKSYLILQFDDRRQAAYAKKLIANMEFKP